MLQMSSIHICICNQYSFLKEEEVDSNYIERDDLLMEENSIPYTEEKMARSLIQIKCYFLGTNKKQIFYRDPL